MVKNFYELKVWQDAHNLTLVIYKTTKDFPTEEKFGLTSQMRRAATSIGANIAEGFGRFHYKDKAKFYQQARGSAVELQNHILVARDLSYFSSAKGKQFFSDIDLIVKEINGLIAAMNKNSNPSS